MVGASTPQPERIVQLALAELSAFLRGAEAGIGPGDLQSRAAVWIETLEGHSWPRDNYPAFFRAVTILTIVAIVSFELELDPQVGRKGGDDDPAAAFISV
ncbi:MAG: hypothetical protein HIU93_11815 [Acidobacteria bacterium]|nr:hypothetical protein [Acidobacteriota bacterium]